MGCCNSPSNSLSVTSNDVQLKLPKDEETRKEIFYSGIHGLSNTPTFFATMDSSVVLVFAYLL
jgi:hypothetical protein